ncbi:MAG: hypothetical protein HYR60_28390 [Acidobacteria bacterium]|nr:hypothetical protein [Acidobacteriota bacterium]
MPQVFYILFGALFTVAVSLALGKLLLRALAAPLPRQEEHAAAFAAGSACLSLIVFLLSAAHLARKGVFLGLGAAILALAIRRGAHRPHGDPLPPLGRFWKWVFGVPYAVFGLLYLLNALLPEISPDGSSYHLAIVAGYLRARGFTPITTNMYASLSHGVDLLFLFAFAFGRHSAAALVHCAFLLALPPAILGYARRQGFPAAGVCAALLVFCSPIFGIDGVSAYNDVALACVVFTLWNLLQLRDARLAIPIGLLAGFGYAIKYTAFLAVPFALALVFFHARKLRPVLMAGGCALLMIAPWTIKNWIVVSNPVSPFFNSVFPNPYVHVSFEKSYTESMRHYDDLKSYRDIPLELTVRGGALGGLLGPAWLLAPLGLLALRSPAGRQLALAALVFGLPYAANIGTRFLLPAAPFLALMMGLALSSWQPLAVLIALAHAVASWPPVMRRYCTPLAWGLDRTPVRSALRLDPEESFLHSKGPRYGVARMIERWTPPGQMVLAMNQIAAAYTTREVLVGYQSALGETLRQILYTPLMEDAIPKGRLRFRFASQPLREIRAVQTARGEPDIWSVGELRVYQGERELPRAPHWRLSARPNPWDVQLAFDNSPLTRWRSWETLYPGMYLAVDFGRIEPIDSVLLECSRDQYKAMVKLEGRGESGPWRELSPAPEDWDAPAEFGLRRGAIEELKARGIGYVLLFDDDFGAQDFRTKGAVWGVTQLAEYYGARLYRLD